MSSFTDTERAVLRVLDEDYLDGGAGQLTVPEIIRRTELPGTCGARKWQAVVRATNSLARQRVVFATGRGFALYP